MTRAATTALERKLGVAFADQRLLLCALTHRSAGPDNYERLEFLGDGVLNCLIGSMLFQLRPQAPEGDLSRLRASLVRESTLARLGRQLGLDEHIQVGSGESGSHRRASVLADVVEALIGAVYLDAGFLPARALVERLFAKELEHLPDAESLKDAKTRLQEFLQGHDRPLPEYMVINSYGPAHQRVFEVQCQLPDSRQITTAQGSSRRRAEQEAASAMLATLRQG